MSKLDSLKEYYKNIPVLVTGGAGFIGSYITEYLVSLGAQVTVLDNLSTGTLDNLAHIWDAISFINTSIYDFDSCLSATWNKKIIFHLAAITSVSQSMRNPIEYHKINSMGTALLLEAARYNKVPTFILSSSCAVYGEQQTLCSEDNICIPTSSYGYSKFIAELYCKEYAQFHTINTVILRYFNVFGARQNPHSPYAAVIAKFKHQLEHNQPLTVYGDGTQTRDFVSVEAITQANIQLATIAHAIRGQVFNIASGRSITLLELIHNLKEKYAKDKKGIQEILFAPARVGDIKHSQADCTRYKKILEQFS